MLAAGEETANEGIKTSKVCRVRDRKGRLSAKRGWWKARERGALETEGAQKRRKETRTCQGALGRASTHA